MFRTILAAALVLSSVAVHAGSRLTIVHPNGTEFIDGAFLALDTTNHAVTFGVDSYDSIAYDRISAGDFDTQYQTWAITLTFADDAPVTFVYPCFALSEEYGALTLSCGR